MLCADVNVLVSWIKTISKTLLTLPGSRGDRVNKLALLHKGDDSRVLRPQGNVSGSDRPVRHNSWFSKLLEINTIHVVNRVQDTFPNPLYAMELSAFLRHLCQHCCWLCTLLLVVTWQQFHEVSRIAVMWQPITESHDDQVTSSPTLVKVLRKHRKNPVDSERYRELYLQLWI